MLRRFFGLREVRDWGVVLLAWAASVAVEVSGLMPFSAWLLFAAGFSVLTWPSPERPYCLGVMAPAVWRRLRRAGAWAVDGLEVLGMMWDAFVEDRIRRR